MYWGKRMSVEMASSNNDYRDVLNDTNSEIVNFFRVCQDRESFRELLHRLKFTPHSRELFNSAKSIDETASELDRAWAWYVLIMGSFANQYRGGYAYSVRSENHADSFRRSVDELHSEFDTIVSRLRSTYIEHVDAIVCCQKYDSPHTLLYLDPPYIGTSQGHYAGYTPEMYQNLLNHLSQCQSSFILSGYNNNDQVPSEWERHDFQANAGGAGGKNGSGKGARTESVWIVRRGMGAETSQMELL